MKKTVCLVVISSLALSIAAHSFFLSEWANGRYMTGNGDGIAQMVIFKSFLYEQYQNGHLFYSYSFGLGGGIYSQLGYYFTTSFVFIASIVVVFFMQLLSLAGPADTLFWAQAAVFISVIKLALIILITTFVFLYMTKNKLAAFTGATIYGISIIYFRHTVFWEFFSDAMLWLPLLVGGAEKIIREKRPGLFITACTITLFNNFYFAYINLLFIVIYVLFRWLIRLGKEETRRIQFRIFAISCLISFGISAVSFVPAVYGFLNNLRPAYDQPIELYDFTDNILFSSRTILLPAIFLLFLFVLSFYKNKTFCLFAAISGLLMLLHFSPLAASAFNGFSAPQNRFEYLLSFTIGGAVAAGLSQFKQMKRKEIVFSSLLVLLLYFVNIHDKEVDLSVVMNWRILILLFVTIIIFIIVRINYEKTHLLLHGCILFTAILVANMYQQYVLSEGSDIQSVSKHYLTSNEYDGEEQRALLQKIKKDDGADPYTRIDWMNGVRNNTPLIQNFNGFSVYSSILNQNLLLFYWKDLEIDMGRESVSRYATMGDRANLYGLLYGKYYMTEKKNEDDVPYGFEKMTESEHYVVYKNKHILPFVRTAKTVFSEKDLNKEPVLAREHAMLEGIVLENPDEKVKPPQVSDLFKGTKVKTKGASYKNDVLNVSAEKGGIDLIPDKTIVAEGDYYVHFYLKSLAKDQFFNLQVNDYVTSRKSNQSIYKTGIYDLTIRVPKAEKISIRLPKGEYALKNVKLYQEDYQTLKKATLSTASTAKMNWERNKLSISLDNKNSDRYMVLPIPYEKGWEVTVNGQKQAVQKANYSFIGFNLEKGENDIQLVYYPPYFKETSIVTIISLAAGIWYSMRKRKLGF
ncbi:YfhO family protein [Bacillus sp. WMMC1349]|uniref:YfhO family protein n=1 Tax=Bacillus sp. WMMC1349 TaxID=2736254 RepID=UPI001555DD7A|nr:YfhO family protein [Bacillus sp. WMMC1349]NPC91903.1 YfhO family protein [Bacillus sp. WMMC1349]